MDVVQTNAVEKPFLNFSCYRFWDCDRDLEEMREKYLSQAKSLELKGTILISPEGMNAFASGPDQNVRKFQNFLKEDTGFDDLWFKESRSKENVFRRMLVRIKKQIIPTEVDSIKPHQCTGPEIEPEELKRWYDEGKEMLILDTRNDYEVSLGTFKDAKHLDIQVFREFDDELDQLDQKWKDKPVVMFCTGGIRCEKASPIMMKKGFKNVYQLKGGILNYFEKVGGDHWVGDCFVFDRRVAVNPQLEETKTTVCFNCRSVVTISEQSEDTYKPNESCPHCYRRRKPS